MTTTPPVTPTTSADQVVDSSLTVDVAIKFNAYYPWVTKESGFESTEAAWAFVDSIAGEEKYADAEWRVIETHRRTLARPVVPVETHAAA